MTHWNPDLHPRDPHSGEFVEGRGLGNWIQNISDAIGQTHGPHKGAPGTIFEGLDVLGDPEFPDGYHFGPDWAREHEDELTSGSLEVWTGEDWDTPQRISVESDGVWIVGADGEVLITHDSPGDVRPAEGGDYS